MNKLKGFQNIEVAVGNATKQICQKKGFFFVKILSDWQKLIDERYIDFCKPTKVSSYKGVNSLLIEVYNSSVLMQMQYEEEAIVERLRLYLGQKYIDRIKFINKPKIIIKKQQAEKKEETKLPAAEEQDLKQQINDLPDENIQNALYRLGKMIKAKTHSVR